MVTELKKIAVFSSKSYDIERLTEANPDDSMLAFTFFEPKLTAQTVSLAKDFDGVCCFVNDQVDDFVAKSLVEYGIRFIAMRCAGFNNVDIEACDRYGVQVARVPEYSPSAVAEHAVALILNLNRNIHRAFSRIRENDYSLGGLMGFGLNGKTVAVIGGGKIGIAFIKIMQGFGCRVLCFDPFPTDELRETGVEIVDLNSIWSESDIISLHCPLVKQTYHIVNSNTLEQMKRGVMLINTSRGALIDTPAVIHALKTGRLGYLGLDVYEEEANLFFEDNSDKVLQDDVFARLTTFKNVVITGHQAFFTIEALQAIANITVSNLTSFYKGETEQVCFVSAK